MGFHTYMFFGFLSFLPATCFLGGKRSFDVLLDRNCSQGKLKLIYLMMLLQAAMIVISLPKYMYMYCPALSSIKFVSQLKYFVYVIAWVAVQFGVNCTSNAIRKEKNCTRRSRVQFTFLVALRVQFIPKLHSNPCYHKLIIITLALLA